MSDAAVDDFTVSGEQDDAAVVRSGDSGSGSGDGTGATGVSTGAAGSDGADGSEIPDGDDAAASEAGRTLANKKGTLQARLNQMTAAQRTAERERDEARAEAARLKAEREAPAKTDEKKAAAEPAYYTRPKPKADEIGTTYADYEAYIEDLTDWKADERDAKREKQAKASESERTNREAFTKVQERIEAFKAEHADYDDVVASAKIPDGSPSYEAVMRHLHHSDFGPQFAYELGKNPVMCQLVFSLPSGPAIEALGELKAEIKARQGAAKSGPASDARAVTKAHPPIKPVGGSPVTSDDDGDPDDLSPAAVDAHIRTQNAKDLARRRR